MDVSRETWPSDSKLESMISRGITDARMSFTSASLIKSLAAHVSAVHTESAKQNLTAIEDADAAVRLHVVDSLKLVAFVPDGVRCVGDLGSGAGFPGIPLALATGLRVSLVESTQKKARFLEQVAAELHAEQITVEAMRAEELAVLKPEQLDVVTARAVSSLAALVELAAPLLRQGGRLLAMKGDPSNDELEHGNRAAHLCGMVPHDVHRYCLPEGETRTVVEYERIGAPSRPLPRRPGAAQKNPLG